MQYKLDVLIERGVLIVVPDEGQYLHVTKWVFKRKSADDQPIKVAIATLPQEVSSKR